MTKTLAILLLAASPAYAGHHGGGGSCSHGGGGSSSGGSYSGGGGGGGSTSSGTSTAEPAHGCQESTDIEGYRECVRYGAWGDNLQLPQFIIELGSNVRQFQTVAGGASGSVTHGAETFAYRVAMPASAQRTELAVTTTARLGIGLGYGFYAALEGELGGLASPAPVTTEMLTTGTYGSPDLQQQRGMFLGAYGVVGVRGGGSRVALAAELAGGVRTVEYSFDSTYHDCEQTSSIDVTRGVVEARARGEVWLAPWVSAGATVGTSVLERGDWMAGLYLGLHSRAYGGLR